MSSDRLPPQNIEAEEAILGGILLDPEAVSRVTELLRPEFFAIEAHQILYKAMWQLYNQGKPTDLMTVTSWLTDNNKLEKIGGQVKIVQLLERTVSAVNIDQYAVLVIDKYIRRKLIQAGNEIFDLGFQTATELKTILDQAEQKIFALTQDKPQQDLVPISETLINTFQEIEDRNEGIALPGLACGFYDLDAMTGGFQRSDLIIVAGRPSMGKCAAYDTLVLQKNGSLITVAEVYQRQETELLTLGKNWKFQVTKPSAFIDDGIKPVFRVTTKSGRFVETTITHPFLTVDGWKPLAKLQVGEKIAVPRRLDIFGDETIPENQFASLIDSDNFCLFPIVFKLEKSQLALFIRYLFSLDGWVKILDSRGVCFGYSVVSEKLVRQVQHLLLRFGIIAAIEKFEEGKSKKGKTNKNLWHLTITEKVSVKNLVVDIGNFPSINLDLSSSRLNLVRQENFWVEKLENTEGFWDKVLDVMEKFALSIILSIQRKNRKVKTEQNSEYLTTTDALFRQNFLANIGSLPSESLDLLRNENALVKKLKGREIFDNEIISVMEKFAKYRCLEAKGRNGKEKTEENFDNLTTTDTFRGKNLLADISSSLSKNLNLVAEENFSVKQLQNADIFDNEIISVMEKFAKYRCLEAKGKNGKEKTEKNCNNLTTSETFRRKNLGADMKNFPSINLDFPSSRLNLLKQENFWVEQLKNTEIFGNEIVVIMEKLAKYRYLLTEGRNGKVKTEENCNNLTTSETFRRKNLGADMKNFPSINLDFPSSRLNLLKQENFWVEQLKNTEIFGNKITSVMEKFAVSKCLSPERRNSTRQTDKKFSHLTTSETLSVKSSVANIANSLSEDLDLLTKENSLVEKLKDWEIFGNEITSVTEKFVASRWFSPGRRNATRQTDKNFSHLTTTDTICGKNLGADMKNISSKSLDFNFDRLNLIRPENSWKEELENREFFWDELVSLVESFVESKSRSVNSRTVKGKSPKNSEDLTTADTICGKNLGADMGNLPSENLDFNSEKLNVVRPENSWRKQLENREFFWDELVSLVESFVESKSRSVNSRTVKGKSPKNSEDLTTADTIYGKNLGADMGNLPSENLDFNSEKLNVVRPENSWKEELENREFFWDELVSLVESFVESQNQSVKSRSGKRTSPKNSENLTIADTICGKNLGADMVNLPSENQDFDSHRLNVVRPENSWSDKLENTEIFWDKLISLVANFFLSKNWSANSRSRKKTSPKNSDNLTTTDTICGKNLGANMENLPSENLGLHSHRLNLAKPENSWSEQLENREFFWNKLVCLMTKFAESQNQSAKNRTVKGKSPKNSDNLTTTDTICGKNILTDMGNLSSENLDFDSEKSSLVKPDNFWSEELENSDIYWDEIVSITAVGEKQVYDLTIPETHNFVANDICLHNTSFAVNIGHSIAANLKLPVAIFSLEMSKEQLVLRLLASEARIESNRLRSGRISQSEWEPLTSAIGTLAEMPIFIDDTPNITVNEIRSKVRQLQSEQGGALGLILLDYLQLMESSSSDNRVQELARITRSLKGLARELSVPIIALSQLSRSVESRTNKRPMMSDLRESGCLTGDTLIYLADGQQIPISRLVGKSNFSVLALNENTGKFESAIVSKVFSTGVKPIFSLQTSSGKLIRATANHPFFSMGGWKQLNTLNIGDSLAILNQKMLKYSILYCGQFLSKVDFGPKYGGNLGSVVKSPEWEKPTKIDVNWDEIVEIRPYGEAEVFDLTVPGLHNFVANEIVVHNSIEQDADLVIMLYRDEYYSPDTPDQGIAEVIITKHRNGPTGTVKLLFDPQFTKFRNLAVNKR
ncbi:replicative DNA helicase [Okeania sp. SIO1I7]|uniref:replicative DNA helicase n=1 Tax=Okeania sp. SIO1I7 TaxID=2607772 RepID=UPI0013F8747C|nr:replicative DNA helicase [Okeania sp. SIO1I7]NET25945.1 replicative DNA helicase [Okeania sp. SIO1I7]